MRRCPNGHDTVEVLADRFRCLECGQYYKEATGEKVEGGLRWTSRVPGTVREAADRDVKAHKRQRNA